MLLPVRTNLNCLILTVPQANYLVLYRLQEPAEMPGLRHFHLIVKRYTWMPFLGRVFCNTISRIIIRLPFSTQSSRLPTLLHQGIILGIWSWDRMVKYMWRNRGHRQCRSLVVPMYLGLGVILRSTVRASDHPFQVTVQAE